MNVIERLKAFLMNRTDEKEFRVTMADLDGLTRDGVANLNAIIEGERRLDGSSGFRVDPACNAGEDIVIHKDPAMVAKPEGGNPGSNVYAGGMTDKRISDEPTPGDNPFRPRYRKLGPKELDHHDRIKLQAMDLLTTFRQIPMIRAQDGNTNDGEGAANIKLAQRHLEDAVYRAVKALTA